MATLKGWGPEVIPTCISVMGGFSPGTTASIKLRIILTRNINAVHSATDSPGHALRP